MEYLLAYFAGLISMVIFYAIFAKPKSYYQNRAEGLENELKNREVFESAMQDEITELRKRLNKPGWDNKQLMKGTV